MKTFNIDDYYDGLMGCYVIPREVYTAFAEAKQQFEFECNRDYDAGKRAEYNRICSVIRNEFYDSIATPVIRAIAPDSDAGRLNPVRVDSDYYGHNNEFEKF